VNVAKKKQMITFSGICDEAAKTLERQCEAHRELGWNHVELRMVDGKNLSTMNENEFGVLCETLDKYGMHVSGYASKIADWSRPITGSFDIDKNDLIQGIPRMKKLNVTGVRIMSYPNDNLSEDQWQKEAIKRIKELSIIAEDNGIILGHENCSGWGGISWQNNLILLEQVNSPALKVLFDTGNPPGYGQSTWEYYSKVKDHIYYVQIKDALHFSRDEETRYTFPGEGDGCVKSIVRDLIYAGYAGFLSIEPHLSSVIHEAKEGESDKKMYAEYVEYGKRMKKIVDEAYADVKMEKV